MARTKTKKPNNNAEITARKLAEGKSLGGRPAFVIDYDKLEKLCGIFCTGEECASILGCSYETLNLRLQEDYQNAVEDNPEETLNKRYNGFQECFKKMSSTGQASLRREQYMMAVGERDQEGKQLTRPDKGMLIWLGKNHLGQSDRFDHTSKGEKLPGSQAVRSDFTRLTNKEFLQFGELLKKAEKPSAPKNPDAKDMH